MKKFLVSLVLNVGLILLIALTGNADAIDFSNIQDNAAVPAGDLSGASTIGQTFVFHYPDLHSIHVRWIASSDLAHTNDSRVILHLRRADETIDLVTASLPLSELHHNDFAKFSFPPIADSQNRSFHFFVDVSQATITRGTISIWASGEDIYPDGTLWLNDVQTDRDLAFRAYYQPDAVTLIETALRLLVVNLGTLVIVIVTPALLGLALLSITRQSGETFIETFVPANGLGLALLSAYALLVLQFGLATIWLVIVGLFLLAGSIWLAQRSIKLPRYNSTQSILIALAILSMGTGLLQVRDLPVPLWVDSPAHASLVAAILQFDRQTLGNFYHMGFHSVVAWFAQSSGIAIPTLMLVFGQWLITLAGLSLFALSKKLTGSDVAGIASAVCIWFLSPTPAYFITWGRYPLLLGVALMPLAILFALEFIEHEKFDAGLFFLSALACVGMTFAHLRLTVPYATFIVIYLLVHTRHPNAIRRAAFILISSILSGVAWFTTFLLSGKSLQDILAQNAAGVDMVDVSTAIAVSLTQHGGFVWVIAAIGALVLVWSRRRNGLVIVGWSIVTFAVAYAPFTRSFITPSFLILLGFMPASLLIGEFVRVISSQRAIVFTTLIAISLVGAYSMQTIVNPATVLFTTADQKAMAWLKQNTPNNARILANSFAWFGDNYQPADGGIWLAQQTGRPTVFLDAGSESLRASPDKLARWIEAQHITYIYLGRRAGILDKTQFVCQPEKYTPLYYQDGITIFGVRPGIDQTAITLPFDCDK